MPGIGRVVRGEPFELSGYVIPPGIEINPSIAGMHRRADSYPEPTRFRPERFLGDDPPDTYTWMPFGGGTRRCLGASFATFEMRVVIRRVWSERPSNRPAGPSRSSAGGSRQMPKDGVRVVQTRTARSVASQRVPARVGA